MAVCAVMHRREELNGFPWIFLGLFGLVHGLNEWLDMLVVALGKDSVPRSLQLGMTFISFIFLTEFGRQGLKQQSKGPGLWIYLPLLTFAAVGALDGPTGFNVAVRYSFCVVGGVMAALTLWRKGKTDESAVSLSYAAIVMVLYVITAGLIVPKANFPPASYINQTSFLILSGVPVQLFRGILAVLCTSLIWNYHQKSRASQLLSDIGKGEEFSGLFLTTTIILLLILGWGGTQVFGNEAIQEVRKDILQLTKTAAAAIDANRLKNLSLDQTDEGKQDYKSLRKQLIALHKANPSFNFIRLLTLQDGRAVVIADSIADGLKGHKEPGATYHQPPEELFRVLPSAKSCTAGPYQEGSGIYVSGFSPLPNPNKGPLTVVSAVISSSSWQKSEAKYRLVAIFTSLVFSVMCIVFFIVRQRMVESSKMLAASQKRLEDARLQKQSELEAINNSLELAVALRTAKLTESNRELQHFAYIASHDLQEPLRTINSFIQLLARRYQGKLDKDADEFIGFITDGSRRMQQLINDLLAYSRVESRGNAFELFESETMLAVVLQNLNHSITESCAQITHDPLPQLYGDRGQIIQLFQNLIGNALKFKGEAAPRIHISCVEQEKQWQISISDNGIGIETRFFERIFEIFQRLHSREQYSGTGIGLAISRKIVERHDGKILVESVPGKGTTFIFTIAKQEFSTTANEIKAELEELTRL